MARFTANASRGAVLIWRQSEAVLPAANTIRQRRRWLLIAGRRVGVAGWGQGSPVASSLPTLSASTYVPGSLTSTGWRPRVTAQF